MRNPPEHPQPVPLADLIPEFLADMQETLTMIELRDQAGATVVKGREDVTAGFGAYVLGNSSEKLFVLPTPKFKEGKAQNMTYFELLQALAAEFAKVDVQFDPKVLYSQARHENAHHYEARGLVTDPYFAKELKLQGKVTSVQAVTLSWNSERKFAMLPHCILKLDPGLTGDQRLYVLARVTLAPSYLHDENHRPIPLSESDRADLEQILAALSDKTPLANTCFRRISEVLEED